MRLHTRWARLALVVALLSLLASACRGTDDPPDTASEEPAEEATGTTTGSTDDATASTPPDGAGGPTGDAAAPADDVAAPSGDVAFDVGVTEEACPDAVNPENGCIYLGTISDLTVGPFAPLAVPITEAQAAFWRTVNEDGGVGGFDINASEYVRDNQYDPELHAQQYEEIKGEVLALAQTLGSPTTVAILDDLEASRIISAPASGASAWLYSDAVVESGSSYCIESMNGLDHLAASGDPVETVMAVHYPGAYGDDGAAGASHWAQANGASFIDVPTAPGVDDQAEVIGRIVSSDADVVVITVGPADAGTLVDQAAAQGFRGRFVFNSPAYHPDLLQSAAAPAVEAAVTVSGPWEPYQTDTPGHQAMRDALGEVTGNDGYTAGWAWSYPLLAVLEQAAANGDLTRAGMAQAASELTSVDYEGMLPEGAGNLAGDPNAAAVRTSAIATPTQDVPSGLEGRGFYEGETAASFEFGDAPCHEAGV